MKKGLLILAAALMTMAPMSASAAARFFVGGPGVYGGYYAPSVSYTHLDVYKRQRAIRPGEELTVDYRFSDDIERVKCCCGSPKCRGQINYKEK